MKHTLIALFALAAVSAFADDATVQKQKDVMKDMRWLAVSVEARATDTNEYPDVTFDELVKLIQPVYIKTAPTVDPWGTPYFYVGNGDHYRFVSAGADGKFEEHSRVMGPTEKDGHPTDDPNADIIFQDGTFTHYPVAGRQE